MEASFLFKVSCELTGFYIFQAQEVILAQHIEDDALPADKQSQVNFYDIH